jgi:hypothetical protein
MILPGETLLVCEMVPALYAAIAANEAERAAPKLTLVDVQMIGAAGRIYMSGKTADVERGLATIESVLAAIGGREGLRPSSALTRRSAAAAAPPSARSSRTISASAAPMGLMVPSVGTIGV